MLGPDIALERVPAEQDSATSKRCDSEACSECRVLLKICTFLQRNELPRPTMRPMKASQEPRAGPGFQLNKDSLSVGRGLLPSSWRCTGVELVRAGKEILKSGCRLLRYWRRRPKRSPRCARGSNSPQVGTEGAQQLLTVPTP